MYELVPRLVPVSLAAAVLAAVALPACDTSGSDSGSGSSDDGYQAPQPAIQVALSGQGAASGLPLATRVEAYVESGRELRLRINNNTQETSSGRLGGPVLTGIGFNLAGDLPRDCLEVVGQESRAPVLVPRAGVLPACVAPTVDPAATLFVVELGADDETPGVARAQTRDLVLRIRDGCPSDFAFTKEGLLGAPRAQAAGRLVQWAGYLDRVGIDGADGGCITGDGEAAPAKPVLDRVWTNFNVTSAELTPQPSRASETDTRAASVEVRFDDRVDRNGQLHPPALPTVIVTLRDGAGTILEQWHVNERHPPETVGEDDCDTATPYERCYLFADDAQGREGLFVEVPRVVEHSNVGFDDDGGRVVVSARAGFTNARDRLQRSVRIEWEHPESIEKARFEVRAQADYNLDGSFEDDPFVPLFRARWGGSGPDLLESPVTVVRQTATSATIEIDVEEAAPYIRQVYGGPP